MKFNTLTSWSYSVYTSYIQCPLSVCFDKIQKFRIKEPPNPHFEKGERIHKEAELYVTVKKPTRLSKDLVDHKAGLDTLRKLKATTEHLWAFTKDYEDTGWYDQDAWLRIKTDACAVQIKPPLVRIIDYKTGKVYDDHKQQRSLYALGGLQRVELGLLAKGDKQVKLTAEHWYTDLKLPAIEEFTMKDLKPLKREWATRIKEMMADTKFRSKPGFYCKSCKFRKSAGGPCPENQ